MEPCYRSLGHRHGQDGQTKDLVRDLQAQREDPASMGKVHRFGFGVLQTVGVPGTSHGNSGG